MDLASFFAETAAAAEGSQVSTFPAVPVSRKPGGNGQAIVEKGISRNSRISREENKGTEFQESSSSPARAGVRASASARDAIADKREQREQREQLAGSDTCISRPLSQKREIERETGNPGPLPAAPGTGWADERAAIMEYDGGLPRAEARYQASPSHSRSAVMGWRAGFASLSVSRIPCPGYTLEGWASSHGRALAFLDTFGEQAEALGWTAPRLFGVHPEIGIIRSDACGGLVLPIGGLAVWL